MSRMKGFSLANVALRRQKLELPICWIIILDFVLLPRSLIRSTEYCTSTYCTCACGAVLGALGGTSTGSEWGGGGRGYVGLVLGLHGCTERCIPGWYLHSTSTVLCTWWYRTYRNVYAQSVPEVPVCRIIVCPVTRKIQKNAFCDIFSLLQPQLRHSQVVLHSKK